MLCWDSKYLALNGYNTTLTALEKIRKDPEVLVPLSEVRKSMISGSPSETKIEKFGTEKLQLKWMSFFKDYQIHLTLASGEDDPNVLGYVTPNAPEDTPNFSGETWMPEDGSDTSGGWISVRHLAWVVEAVANMTGQAEVALVQVAGEVVQEAEPGHSEEAVHPGGFLVRFSRSGCRPNWG